MEVEYMERQSLYLDGGLLAIGAKPSAAITQK